jgi:hypothetical protein
VIRNQNKSTSIEQTIEHPRFFSPRFVPLGRGECRRHEFVAEGKFFERKRHFVRSAFCDQEISKQRVPASSKFSFFLSRFVPLGRGECRRQTCVAEGKISDERET